MTKKKIRVSTRDRIMDAALELFVEEGYGGTTITEVERRVGLSPGSGSFYRHFASKEALLSAAVEREVALRRAEIAEARATPLVSEETHEERRLGLQLALRDIQRFDRLFRLALSEGASVSEVRETISSALQGMPQELPEGAHVMMVVVNAALAGYHYSSIVQGQPFQGVAEEDFLDALTTVLEVLHDRHLW